MKNKRNFRVLETFRFIAAILIALGHFSLNYLKLPVSIILGVDFFFVLSGFLLTYKEENIKNISSYSKQFFIERVVRLLFPSALVIIFYFSVLYKVIYPEKNAVTLFEYFISTFLLKILVIKGIETLTVSGLWAIGLELYIGTLFFPTIAYIKKKYCDFLVIFCLTLFILCLNIMVNNSPRFMDVHYQKWYGIPLGIFRIIISYSVGTISGVLFNKIKDKKFKNYKFIYTILEIVIIFIILKYYGKITFVRENEYIFPIIAGILIVIFSQEKGVLSSLLKRISFLGSLSYPIYILHPIFLEIIKNYLKKDSTNNTIIVGYIVCVLFSAFLFYKFIESPVVSLKYKIREKWQ